MIISNCSEKDENMKKQNFQTNYGNFKKNNFPKIIMNSYEQIKMFKKIMNDVAFGSNSKAKFTMFFEV